MKYIYRFLIVVALFFSFSCEEKITEINIDPDTAPTAGEAQLLVGAIGMIGYNNEVSLNDYSYLWAQYYTWGIGVSLGNQERFVQQGSDNNRYWEYAYSDCLIDLTKLVGSESKAYQGVGKTLKAYVYQGLVDHFGDIPYTEATRGEIDAGGILTPAFDPAATVYDSLVVLLDEAIADLAFADANGLTDVGDDDLIFGGDMRAWLKFANSLKLRVLLRTSETDPQGAAIQSLINSGMFIETAADMPAIPFVDKAGNQNPMYARREFGVGDFYFASNASLNVLASLNDPRDTVFYAEASIGTYAGALRGIDQGTIDDEPFTAAKEEYSTSTPYSYAADNPVVLMSPWEVWFLRAEADARYGTADDETTAFASAISESFSYCGLSSTVATNYTTSLGYAAGDPLDTKLDLIGVQKWISMNGTQEDEGWIETRRFDRPASRLFTNGIFQDPPKSQLAAGEYPSTWLYPAIETSLNSKAPAQRKITDKIFWDN
ncbi:MAG: SusD/RagB family nutrient-binding outer membrane lipoprotein [Bacteroidota bacterium]